MTDDERPGSHERDDDFWGNTPDWTDAAERPRRQRRSERPNDITGAIKNMWGTAMTGGASATRSHGVFDATAPRPVEETDLGAFSGLDPAMFDDLGHETGPVLDPGATTEVPVIEARRGRAPAPGMSVEPSRSGRRIDPFLARIGAVAVVTTLLVPLAIGLRSGDADDTVTSADAAASMAPVAEISLPEATVEASAPAPVGSVSLDPSSLPPAVPANSSARTTEAPASSDSSDTTTADGGGSTLDPSPDLAAAVATDSFDATPGDDDVSNDQSKGGETTGVAVAGATDAAPDDRVCAVGYIVRSGDYWIGLADGAGVPLAELLEVNDATAATALYPGADICLPAGSTTPSTTVPPATTPATTTPATTAAPTTAAPTTAPPTVAVPTTDAPTTTVATTTAAPAPSPAGPDDVKQIIRDVWPDELEDRALEIAFRESSYVPTAKNFCCYGLFQIYWEVHDSWLGEIGVTSAGQLYDPATNARAAYALYQRAAGWGPWAQTDY